MEREFNPQPINNDLCELQAFIMAIVRRSNPNVIEIRDIADLDKLARSLSNVAKGLADLDKRQADKRRAIDAASHELYLRVQRDLTGRPDLVAQMVPLIEASQRKLLDE